MSLNELQDVLQFTKDWYKHNLEASIISYKLSGIIAKHDAKVYYNNVLLDKQKDQLKSKALELIK